MTRTFLDLQDEVLGFGFPVSYRGRVQDWLNEAHHRMLRRVPVFPGNLSDATVDTTIGTQRVTMGSSLLHIESVTVNDTGEQVKLLSLEQLLQLEPGASGGPQFFAMATTTTAYVWPTPDLVYTLRVIAYPDEIDMAHDTDEPAIPNTYRDALVSYAVAKCYLNEDDASMYQTHFANWTRSLQEFGTDVPYQVRESKQVPGTWSARR